MNLFKNLRYPDKKSVFRPALKEIPKDLYDAFTMNGYMPLTKTWYFNEVFGDADSNNTNAKAPVDRQSFENYRKKAIILLLFFFMNFKLIFFKKRLGNGNH